MPTFISTPGHGYLKVTLNQLAEAFRYSGYRPTEYSMASISGTHALLEEDVDAGMFLDAMGISTQESKQYKVQYRKEGIDYSKYMVIPQTREDLNKWIRTVAQRTELSKGAIVEIDCCKSRQWTVVEARRTRKKVEYSLDNRRTGEWGWANANRITNIL